MIAKGFFGDRFCNFESTTTGAASKEDKAPAAVKITSIPYDTNLGTLHPYQKPPFQEFVYAILGPPPTP